MSCPPKCLDCGGLAKWGSSYDRGGVYVMPFNPSHGLQRFWFCEKCETFTKTNIEGRVVGRLANTSLRHWRALAHALFDPFWISGRIPSREEAERRMAAKLGRKHFRIASADLKTVKRVVEIITGGKAA